MTQRMEMDFTKFSNIKKFHCLFSNYELYSTYEVHLSLCSTILIETMDSFVIDETYINNLINSQQSAIKYYIIFAIGIFTIGIAVLIISLVLPPNVLGEGIKTLLSIGGGFVSSISGLQIKEIIQRKEKIGVYNLMKKQLAANFDKNANTDSEETIRLKEILWKSIEKTALS